MLIKEKAINILNNSDSKSYLRIEALFKLMNIADQESLYSLFKTLKEDSCELVRHEAAFCLGEVASNEAVKILKEVYDKDDSIIVKHECLMSLGTIANKKDIDFVEKALKHPIYEVHASAEIAKSRINQEEEFEVHNIKDIEKIRDKYIKRLLNPVHTSKNDRIQIIFQLMNIADDKSIDELYNCLVNDPCTIVKHEAAFVLGEIGCDKSTYYLEQAIKQETNPVVIHEALFALGTSGNKNVKNFIKTYLNHEEYIVSESAKIAIDRINLLENPYSGKDEYMYLKN